MRSILCCTLRCTIDCTLCCYCTVHCAVLCTVHCVANCTGVESNVGGGGLKSPLDQKELNHISQSLLEERKQRPDFFRKNLSTNLEESRTGSVTSHGHTPQHTTQTHAPHAQETSYLAGGSTPDRQTIFYYSLIPSSEKRKKNIPREMLPTMCAPCFTVWSLVE